MKEFVGRIALRIQLVITFVGLAAVYFCVLTPIAIVRRLSGHDPLGARQRAGQSDGGWESADVSLEDHDTTRMY